MIFINHKMEGNLESEETRSRPEKKFTSERWRSPSPPMRKSVSEIQKPKVRNEDKDEDKDEDEDEDKDKDEELTKKKKYSIYYDVEKIEETSRINSVDYLSPSQSKKFTVYDVVDKEESIERALKHFQNFKPDETIKIGQLRFNMILRKDNEFVWEDLDEYFTSNTDYLCKGYLGSRYISRNYETNANLIVYCSIHDPTLYEETGVDMLVGVFIADYTPERAHVIATCFSGGVPKGGLLLRCIGLSVLKKMGYKHSYTEAINGKLVKYYDKIGYRLMETVCGEEDRLVEMYEKGFTLDEIMESIEVLESEYLTGWKMKWCDYDEENICREALDGLLSRKY